MVRSEEGKNFTGNDKYMGYCVDLTEKIAQMLNFTYELRLVKDNHFGAKGYRLSRNTYWQLLTIFLFHFIFRCEWRVEWNGNFIC